ncbi:MAG: DUF559 domain-containing protein [Clostridia bacterium]|nr:DUF559 domain-containing protein [Clostridia bacterium]
MPIRYNGKNIHLARNLRKYATKQENHLWYDFLSKYKIRFQRQKMIDEYIADFYCDKAKLIIEIDGSQHYSSKGMEEDEKRTKKLEKYGIEVIRIENRQIDKDFGEVCGYIDYKVKQRIEAREKEGK